MASLVASPTPVTMASLVASPTFLAPNLNKSSIRLRSNFSIPKLSLLTSNPQFNPLQPIPKLRVSPSSAAPSLHPTPSPSSPNNPFSSTLFSDSTRSIVTIIALGLSLSKVFAETIKGISLKFKGIHLTPTPEELAAIQKLQGNLVCTIGPLFFASVRARPRGYLNTPLTVVASGMSKWLDIYSGVLMVRVLLSWFPNIPWDRQPLSAIRDLCDPYLNLFRNIIPPIFDTLDVSPLLAFAVLGTLGSILNNSRGIY